uniref:Proteasome subunit beta n=1 Tax=Palpitomonas bilix TaxID=652834 RepID=A0A7S3GE47_9EUKA|mmetsp:Transcript_45585/g.117843  ORF Transcript_45585/g.117843 Transcript_45585/m.117843 type:complete len:201 (+) Transcript_45585:120-722(+)
MNSIMAPVAIQEPGNYHAKGPIPESRVAPVAGHGPMQANFSPYMDNGGTIAAIAGENFVVLAADTRLSLGYAILSRDNSKMSALTPKCYIASSGMNADITTLHKVLKMRAVQYQQKHGKDMSCHAAANLLSRTLYYKRFFPYYTFNLLVGVDNEGSYRLFFRLFAGLKFVGVKEKELSISTTRLATLSRCRTPLLGLGVR